MSVLIKGMEMPIACSQCCLTGTCRWYLEVESMFDRHRDCPLVEVEEDTRPKKGKWIKTGRRGRVYQCDQCGNYLDFDGVNAGRGSANFCPNCGADMRGEE